MHWIQLLKPVNAQEIATPLCHTPLSPFSCTSWSQIDLLSFKDCPWSFSSYPEFLPLVRLTLKRMEIS